MTQIRANEKKSDLIWSSMWTHEGPQLDVSLPLHAIAYEPKTLISYTTSYFLKLDPPSYKTRLLF